MDMDLSKLFDAKIIDLNMNVSTKKDAIKHLTDLLFDAGYVNDKQDYIEDIYRREEQGITGMGNGIAIPHGKSGSVLKTGLAVGKSTQKIEWESYDNQPVDIVFLFAVPDKKEGNIIHLKLLSKVAGKLGNEEILKKIRAAKTAEDIKECMFE
ncbi:PTS sugar transporter subunit IIA [Lactobacillus sp. ESL0791]|uniref:PTS sugar transporter subunit IIA n=1 Tax=Lactobacillus sp. ESL0791 TaxID=2983234 RepID=UPI0023F7CB2C|nr:PTS sugar transporter subunit IIA [Lactobacillus sp. ESL0791]MDF7638286.1 PTS sugar transporter subunit IIA [Lactobacillus sp. ESL0791]